MNAKDRYIEDAYALATHEVIRLVQEGFDVDRAVGMVIARPPRALGLMQIAQLQREAVVEVPKYLATVRS